MPKSSDSIAFLQIESAQPWVDRRSWGDGAESWHPIYARSPELARFILQHALVWDPKPDWSRNDAVQLTVEALRQIEIRDPEQFADLAVHAERYVGEVKHASRHAAEVMEAFRHCGWPAQTEHVSSMPSLCVSYKHKNRDYNQDIRAYVDAVKAYCHAHPFVVINMSSGKTTIEEFNRLNPFDPRDQASIAILKELGEIENLVICRAAGNEAPLNNGLTIANLPNCISVGKGNAQGYSGPSANHAVTVYTDAKPFDQASYASPRLANFCCKLVQRYREAHKGATPPAHWVVQAMVHSARHQPVTSHRPEFRWDENAGAGYLNCNERQQWNHQSDLDRAYDYLAMLACEGVGATIEDDPQWVGSELVMHRFGGTAGATLHCPMRLEDTAYLGKVTLEFSFQNLSLEEARGVRITLVAPSGSPALLLKGDSPILHNQMATHGFNGLAIEKGEGPCNWQIEVTGVPLQDPPVELTARVNGSVYSQPIPTRQDIIHATTDAKFACNEPMERAR
jgi:hypothetical protein